MTYIEGFVAAVPKANKEKFIKHAEAAAQMFRDCGAKYLVENWEDDIQDGKLNDLRTAVKAKPDEAVVFSWFEYPDKKSRDESNAKMQADPRMKEMGDDMPFDGERLIFGGFAGLHEEKTDRDSGYIDGCLIPVPVAKKEAVKAFAEQSAKIFIEHGATRVVDTWGDDIPDGEVTDFKRAVLAEKNETVDFGWIEWPSKAARDAGWENIMQDTRMQQADAPFDGRRMIFGGFTPVVKA